MGAAYTAQLKEEKVQEGWQHIKDCLISYGIEPKEKRIRYFYNFWLAGMLLKREYTQAAGNQD